MKKVSEEAQQELPLTSVMAHTRFPGRSSLYVSEVADALEMSADHVIDLITEGKITAINISADPDTRKNWRIPVSAYDAFIEGNKSV